MSRAYRCCCAPLMTCQQWPPSWLRVVAGQLLDDDSGNPEAGQDMAASLGQYLLMTEG
jgi:hypothetical protein